VIWTTKAGGRKASGIREMEAKTDLLLSQVHRREGGREDSRKKMSEGESQTVSRGSESSQGANKGPSFG